MKVNKDFWVNAEETQDHLFKLLKQKKVQCLACAHKCIICNGEHGVCRIRHNFDGKLWIPWGYVSTIKKESIEKKPLFHFLPGASTLSFGIAGCSFRCGFCQNWPLSQGFDEITAEPLMQTNFMTITPQEIVDKARETGSGILASSYNEPFVSIEWASEIFKLAQASGIYCVLISNGYASQEAFQDISPLLNGCKVDLKSMREGTYEKFGGNLHKVLDFIGEIHKKGIWLEVVTLVVPGINDDLGELREAARFISSLSTQIPWHVTTFYPDFHEGNRPQTPPRTVINAVEIGFAEGIKYVYAGGTAKELESYNHTYCPVCNTCLIKRYRQMNISVAVDHQGRCPHCGSTIAGIWNKDSSNLPDKSIPSPSSLAE